MPAEEPLEYTQFDTEPAIEEDLEEQDPDTGAWGPMDLTGKTVRLLAEHRRSKRRFGGAAPQVTLPPGPGGVTPTRVRYAIQAGDLSEDGDYYFQWEISTPAGALRTVPPGDGYRELRARRKLGEAA